MYAGSDQPFRNFAAALNSPEVNTFTIALQQAQKNGQGTESSYYGCTD